MGGFVSAVVTIPIYRPKETSVNVNAGFNKSSDNLGGGVRGSWTHNFGNNTGSLSVNGVYNSNVNKLVNNVLQSSNLNFLLPVTFRYGRGSFGYMLNPNFSFTRNGNTLNAGLGFDAMDIKDPKIMTNFSYNNSNELNEL